MTTTELNHEIKFTKCGIDFITFLKDGFFIARASRLLKSGRNAHVFGYKFRTEAERDTYVNKYIAAQEKQLDAKNAHKQAKKDAKNFTINPFKVGDIFVDSWGYDQTNIDFYQVIEVKPKSVIIKEICGSVVPGSEGMDCCRLVPVKDAFKSKSEPITKLVTVAVYNDKVTYYLTFNHGWCSKHVEGQDYYNSWYA